MLDFCVDIFWIWNNTDKCTIYINFGKIKWAFENQSIVHCLYSMTLTITKSKRHKKFNKHIQRAPVNVKHN